jgi:hypothetical protein
MTTLRRENSTEFMISTVAQERRRGIAAQRFLRNYATQLPGSELTPGAPTGPACRERW